ncbi:MAG: putative methyltransferase [Ferruginibacter sp.]|nr:putative methyltransferase [Ferruginibacter sp.]
MNTDLVTYYNKRAKEYEAIYQKPERQEDLKTLATLLRDHFAGKNILEIACGTGYWTNVIAKTAASVFATDISEAVLEIAKSKNYGAARVSFGMEDFDNYRPTKRFESLLGGFIWSHIHLQDLKKFLENVNRCVLPGGSVVLLDNNYVPGSNLPLSTINEHGNSFQTRKLSDGSTHLVCKNFPSEAFIMKQIEGIATDIRFINLEYYWMLIYRPVQH